MSEAEKRLSAMVAEANMGLDATSKSLRGYTTYPHRMFVERLRQHYPELGPMESRKGRTFTYETASEGLTGSQMLNTALQSFYEQEVNPGTEMTIIYPKISKKTLTGPDSDEETMRLLVEGWVSDYASLKNNVASFREMAIGELGEHTVSNLLDDFVSSQLSRSIVNHLLMYNWSFPAHKPVRVDGRKSPIGGLTMKTKYYVSRDDHRAYCQDRNRLRLLAGACLHRLILPKSLSTRARLDVARIVRAKGKDELRLVVPVAREKQRTLLVLGDISNFTGSLANSWLMLFALCLDLAKNLRNKFSLFSVGGVLLYATWFEIVAVYLYLTVGAECYVQDLDRYETLSGGFLGVTSNITAGLLCLSLILADLTRRILPRVYHVQSQAGGDDFAFVLVVAEGHGDQVIDYIKNDMQRHVGQLKEFKVLDLDDADEGVIDGAYFCRKRVTLKRTSTHTVVGHEPSCPLHESILPNTTIVRQDLQQRAWTELDCGLSAYEDQCPHMLPFTDALREVFLVRYPRVNPTRSWATRFWPPSGLAGSLRHGYLISDKAYEAIAMVERVDIGPYYALASLTSKIRHLQVLEILVSYEVMYKGEVLNAYITREETGCLVTERVVELICVRPSEESKNRLLKLLA